MNVVFSKPSRDIPSYRDFFRLAEMSGFQVREGTIERKQDEVYIGLFHHQPSMVGVGGKVVMWFLERPASNGGVQNFHQFLNGIKESRRVDEVWISDLSMFELVKDISKFVPVGSHENISPQFVSRTYDLADICYRHGRRAFISSLSCKVAPPRFYPERDSVLSHSAFMLNVHQDEDRFFEPFRFCLAAASGIPIITETCSNPFPYEGQAVIQSEYNNIISTIHRVLSENYEGHKRNAEEMRRMILSNYRFRDCVLKALGD